MAQAFVSRKLVKLRAQPVWREGFVTDNGNHILDVHDLNISNPLEMETRLNQIVGKRLREKRSGAKLTLKQLANRTGLSVSLISQIELGKSAASMSTMHKLSTALQVKMTYFFETV